MTAQHLRYLTCHALRRPTCVLMGCRAEGHDPSCDRCGEWMYGDWIEPHDSIVGPLRPLWWRLHDRVAGRCAECGKRLPLAQRLRLHREWPEFCSKECEEGWMPF